MKDLILILCLAVITHQSEENIHGSPISFLSPTLLSPRLTTTTCSNNAIGQICGDCNTLLTCLGDSKPIKTQICEKTYPGNPYCVDGGCNSSPDPNDKECSKSSSGITCTGIGFFPNPLNCSQYYFCEGPNGASKFYECPSGFVYNPLTKRCKRRILPSDCSTVNCDSYPDLNVAYPADPSLYAFCLVTDGIATPIVFRCLGAEQFVQSKHRCVFQCKKEGRAVDGRDCMKYYECYRNGLSYIMVHETCMTGFVFDSEVDDCVLGKCAGDEGSEAGDGTG